MNTYPLVMTAAIAPVAWQVYRYQITPSPKLNAPYANSPAAHYPSSGFNYCAGQKDGTAFLATAPPAAAAQAANAAHNFQPTRWGCAVAAVLCRRSAVLSAESSGAIMRHTRTLSLGCKS